MTCSSVCVTLAIVDSKCGVLHLDLSFLTEKDHAFSFCLSPQPLVAPALIASKPASPPASAQTRPMLGNSLIPNY